MLSSGNGVVADGVQNLGKEPVVHGVAERTRLCVVGIIHGVVNILIYSPFSLYYL